MLPVFLFSSLKQFWDGESGIKQPLKLLPKGKACPCARGRGSPQAPQIKLTVEKITHVPVIL